jgi:hypothetical protein
MRNRTGSSACVRRSVTGQEGAISLAHPRISLRVLGFACPVALQQINLRVEAGLLASLKVLAKERGLSLNAVAALAFERLLQERPQAPASTTGSDGRFDALERRVAALEAQAAHPPKERKPSPQKEPPAIPQMGEAAAVKVVQAAPVQNFPDGAITTAELAEATGTNRAAWNNWARDKNPGAVRKMKADVGNWRYLGKAASEMGGPERGLWEKA